MQPYALCIMHYKALDHVNISKVFEIYLFVTFRFIFIFIG